MKYMMLDHLEVLDDIIHHLSAADFKFLAVHVVAETSHDCGRARRPGRSSSISVPK